MQIFDLHTHLLPGLDDGPATLDGTVALLHHAWEGGTRGMVATSHLYAPYFPDSTFERILQTYEATVAELATLAENPDHEFLGEIDIFLGAEHYCDNDFLAALDRGEVIPINGGKYLLLEFPSTIPEQTAHAAAVRVRQAGFLPVIAHVERYGFVQARPERLEPFIDIGCLIQINADSTLGSRFGSTRRLTHAILKMGLAHLIASDGHDTESRPPGLGAAAESLVRPFGEEAVREWVWEAPRRIVGESRQRTG